MLNKISKLVFFLFVSAAFAQSGHLMQGVGAINMSMGGAATGQPLDISGAMHWNPAGLASFSGTRLKLDVGMFKGTPTLYSSLPEGAMWGEGDLGPGVPASPPVTGKTESELGYMAMPALAISWGKEESKSRFGVSIFGVSGFGVDFPEETNLPMNADGSPNMEWDPNNSNAILYPQSLKGFGNLKSSYMMMQIGFTWAYKFSPKFSIGLQPTFNYQSLELAPNPIARPSMTKGYPISDASASYGYGGQVGLFFDSLNGFKIGASYKTKQFMSDYDFTSKYLDGSAADPVAFSMNFPAIYSVGIGFSKGIIDIGVDYRYVDYENTEGFDNSGWERFDDGPFEGFPTGAVSGFGWKSMSIVSAGLQFKGIKKVPIRIGYTYNTNPIQDELAFFSTPATAIITNAFQAGFSILFSEGFSLDAVYHYGKSSGKTSGQLLNPMAVRPDNPLGAIPGSEVAYDMNTQLFMLGLNFKFGGKDTDGDGIRDKDDACPEVAGLEKFNGCPDSDGDGIQDSQDACPNEAGLAEFNGCPDRDGDGIMDKEDYCPDEAGLEQFNGCPDSDGDGVMDKDDDCPNEAGLVENRGCPLVDTDGDGIADKDDDCPNIAGEASNRGCPMVTQEVQKQITDLARAIFFNVNKFTFTDETQIRLAKISGILDHYKNINFTVEGHTDDTGAAAYNKKLSQKRADAVRDYLVEHGFPADKITAIGYGEEKPICSTKTKKCRQANRRVDIFSENATRD